MAVKTPWFDDSTDTPLIAEYARKLDSFLDAVADMRIETRELDEQEKRVVALMKKHLALRNMKCSAMKLSECEQEHEPEKDEDYSR